MGKYPLQIAVRGDLSMNDRSGMSTGVGRPALAEPHPENLVALDERKRGDPQG